MKQLVQVAPWPEALEDLVRRSRYRAHEGWSVRLVEDFARDENASREVIGHGTTLIVTTQGYDTYHPERGTTYGVNHYFIVPAATYNRSSWRRWLFEQYAKIERHECMENFVVDTDERPFAPLHGPGEDPYSVHEYADQEQKDRRYFDHSADEHFDHSADEPLPWGDGVLADLPKLVRE